VNTYSSAPTAPLTLEAIRDAVAKVDALVEIARARASASPVERLRAFAEAVMAGADVRESPLVDGIAVFQGGDGRRATILYPQGGRAAFDALVERVNEAMETEQ
jgi:hypothetical protein